MMFTLVEARHNNFTKEVTITSGRQACRLLLLVYCFDLKMEVIRSSETLGCLRTAWPYNPEAHTLPRQGNDSEDTEISLVGATEDSKAFTRWTAVFMGFVYLRDSQSLPDLRGTCLMAHSVGRQLLPAYRLLFELWAGRSDFDSSWDLPLFFLWGGTYAPVRSLLQAP
jgi:hypothetical protein